ncbi:hypothetical protein DYB35_009515 [Aphanomyces astaci]|uniref:DDE-1 domain-containing protein n=1 Tax=Aphanomyces astaci TaxID=112090 RepID=A0A3R7AT31_APHAT|nr:hypothetical protein DYB35_009515 [Aphanomyces astaci]
MAPPGKKRRYTPVDLEQAVISSARNSIDEAGVALLFDSMSEAMKEHNFTADRIFNMDETSFTSRRKSKDVVASLD